ncbi:MAG: hypothetical protein RJA14_633, partial [Pseudomonadota bacterium]
MFDFKKTNILLAMAAAGVLMAGTPVLAQDAPAAAPAAAAAAPAADAAAPAAAPAAEAEPAAEGAHGKLTPASMFMEADPVVKVVMIGLVLASVFSWVLLLIKMFEFGALNRKTDQFLESFRQARTIADMRKVATSDEFDGNPLADMA